MKRYNLAHFVDTSMNGDSASYHLIGEGVASLSEEFNPESDTQQWINQENGTTDIKSYNPSINIERQNIDQDDTELTEWFNEMIDTLPTGSNAVTNYVRVRIVGNGPTYPAVKRNCSVSVNSTGGDAGSNVTDSITLGGRGDGVKGTFNPQTKTFTHGTAGTGLSD